MLIVLWRIRSDHHYQPWARQIQPKVHASPGFRRDTVLLDLMCWFEPFVKLRAPKMFNLRRDPFERADENSNTYWDWLLSHAYIMYEMQAIVAQQIGTSKNFRRARSRPHLIWTRSCASSRTPPAAPTID